MQMDWDFKSGFKIRLDFVGTQSAVVNDLQRCDEDFTKKCNSNSKASPRKYGLKLTHTIKKKHTTRARDKTYCNNKQYETSSIRISGSVCSGYCIINHNLWQLECNRSLSFLPWWCTESVEAWADSWGETSEVPCYSNLSKKNWKNCVNCESNKVDAIPTVYTHSYSKHSGKALYSHIQLYRPFPTNPPPKRRVQERKQYIYIF